MNIRNRHVKSNGFVKIFKDPFFLQKLEAKYKDFSSCSGRNTYRNGQAFQTPK